MPFIPHTQDDIERMLAAIGADGVETLFEEIPDRLRVVDGLNLPPALNEMAVGRLMRERAAQDGAPICFAGAGAYDHHIPAAVWEIASRGEFYSAYTPYQAEASQGILQTLYEFQTMMAGLTALDLSNASLYDGASALGEALLMAVRANRNGSRRILMPQSVHPHYRQTARTLVEPQGIEVIEIPVSPSGALSLESLTPFEREPCAALVIPQPNFFGVLEEADQLTDWARRQGALVVGLVNPMSLALLSPPGDWGEQGADIACGDGQPLGAPLSSGGPYFGFLCCRDAHKRQMPGRIVGRTADHSGREGFVLTLQAREQHIRRSRATSNICTNQGLMTVAASIYMSLLGPEGLRRVALACMSNTETLLQRLTAINGVERVHSGHCFHEALLRLPKPVGDVLDALARRGIVGGVDVQALDADLPSGLLVCAVETRTEAEISAFAEALQSILEG